MSYSSDSGARNVPHRDALSEADEGSRAHRDDATFVQWAQFRIAFRIFLVVAVTATALAVAVFRGVDIVFVAIGLIVYLLLLGAPCWIAMIHEEGSEELNRRHHEPKR